MKQLTLSGHTLLAYQPEMDIKDVSAENNTLWISGLGHHSEEWEIWSEDIPDGFSLLGPGLASEIREEDVPEGLVEKNEYGHDGWKTYTEELMFWEPTRLASLHSFIRANGLEVDKIVLLISKK